MSTEANKALVRRYFDEIVSRGQFDAADELFHPDFTGPNAAPDAPRGPESPKLNWRRWRAAFPDWTATVAFQIAEDDLVATRITAHGTHRGDLASPNTAVLPTLPATGNHATV